MPAEILIRARSASFDVFLRVIGGMNQLLLPARPHRFVRTNEENERDGNGKDGSSQCENRLRVAGDSAAVDNTEHDGLQTKHGH